VDQALRGEDTEPYHRGCSPSLMRFPAPFRGAHPFGGVTQGPATAGAVLPWLIPLVPAGRFEALGWATSLRESGLSNFSL
jgi:hypothetical protein